MLASVPETKLIGSSNQSAFMRLTQLENTRLKLIYRASEVVNGYRSSSFHSYCDGRGATLLVGQSQTGYIFGGKASRDWGSEINGNYRDAQAFIYSWTNPFNTPVRLRNINQDAGMVSHVNNGPTFGHGHDLHIADNCNQNENSYTKINHAFRFTKDKLSCDFGRFVLIIY